MNKTLKYSDIAYKILKEDDKVRSLHYKLIAKRAFEQGLIESDDIITSGNISSAINADIRNAQINGKASRFISYGKGRFGLSENEPQGIFKEVRDKNNAVKKQLLESLLSMSPFGFEDLVAEVLRHLGFENINVTAKTGDGGIDVTGELVVAGAIKNNICVQVKRWRNNVQRGSIAELRGSLRPYQTGLFITTSDFSKPAIDEANDPYKAPISLINGKELVEIMCSYGIGVTADEVTILEIDNSNDYIDSISSIPNKENGIKIFARYKKQEYYAIYFNESKILLDDVIYKSVSAAANKIVNGNQVNGWRFWKFIDETSGKEYPIDRLRKEK